VKKILLLSISNFLCCLLTTAQTLSVTGYGGYTFQDKVSFSNAYGYVTDGGHWGVSAEGISRSGNGAEILYQQQNTRTPMYYYNSPGEQINKDADQATVSYIMLNGIRYLPRQKIQPYGGLGLGIAILSSKSYSSQTKFAWDAKIGAKLKASSRLGIKLQAQLYSIVQAAGGDFYAGTGGSGFSANSYSSIYQFGFSGGICLDFEKKRLP
jgi:hypothetical protein